MASSSSPNPLAKFLATALIYDPQPQSRFLSLPGEIRNRIYAYAYGAGDFTMSYYRKPGDPLPRHFRAPKREGPLSPSQVPSNSICSPPVKGALSFTTTCRQIYVESYLLIHEVYNLLDQVVIQFSADDHALYEKISRLHLHHPLPIRTVRITDIMAGRQTHHDMLESLVCLAPAVERIEVQVVEWCDVRELTARDFWSWEWLGLCQPACKRPTQRIMFHTRQLAGCKLEGVARNPYRWENGRAVAAGTQWGLIFLKDGKRITDREEFDGVIGKNGGYVIPEEPH